MSTYEVRGCVKVGEGEVNSFPLSVAADNEAAEWFGIYENLPDGTQQCVVDIPTLGRAHSIADWLTSAPQGVRIPTLELDS